MIITLCFNLNGGYVRHIRRFFCVQGVIIKMVLFWIYKFPIGT
jgi:hypothetical protein